MDLQRPLHVLTILARRLHAAWQVEPSLASPEGTLVFLLERDDAFKISLHPLHPRPGGT